MKKRTIAMIVSLVLALALGLGGTLAYLTDTDADVNTMVLGNVQIVQNEQRRVEKDGVFTNVLEAYQNDKTLVPYTDREENTPDTVTIGEYQVTINDRYNNYIDKIVTVTNTGNSDAYVRTLVALPTGGTEHWRQYDAAADVWLHWNLCNDVYTHWALEEVTGPGKFFIEVGGVEYEVWQFTHKEPLAPGAITYPSLTGVFMDKRVDMNENGYFMTVGTETYPITKIADAEGKLNVLVLSQAVQAAGFADAETALNEAFPVTSANLNAWFNKLEVGSPGDKNDTNNPPEIKLPHGDDDNVTYEAPADAKEVSNSADLTQAVADGYTVIKLTDGVYDVYGCGGKTLSLYGSKDAVLKLYNDGEDGCDYAFGSAGTGVGNVTFNGITIDTTENTGNYKGFAYMKGTFNDCSFVGAYSLNNANDFEFNYCDFDFKNGYFWTWGANNATFNNCTFNGNSKCILAHGYASTQITINNCKFAATEKGYTGSGDNTACVEIDPAGTNTYTITFTGYNTKTDSYSGWTRVKDSSTGHVITGLE